MYLDDGRDIYISCVYQKFYCNGLYFWGVYLIKLLLVGSVCLLGWKEGVSRLQLISEINGGWFEKEIWILLRLLSRD